MDFEDLIQQLFNDAGVPAPTLKKKDERPVVGKLVVGKTYRARDGRGTFKIINISDEPNTAEGFRVTALRVGCGDTFPFFRDGRFKEEAGSVLDLVEEVVEKKRIKRFLNIYKNSNGSYSPGEALHTTRNSASAVLGPGRKLIACVEIDVEEGHGLQDEEA